MFSLVPGRKLPSNRPFLVGSTVFVKFAGKKRDIVKEKGKIISKGNSIRCMQSVQEALA